MVSDSATLAGTSKLVIGTGYRNLSFDVDLTDSNEINIPVDNAGELRTPVSQQGTGYQNAVFENDVADRNLDGINIPLQNIGNPPIQVVPQETNAEGEASQTNRDRWVDSGFLMSCISMSVGLGNVWRFPFVAFQNGGGAFLIPYLIILTLVGRPIYFMEMCLGQFSSYGPVRVWNMSPIFRGVGYGMMIGCICVVSFYCAIMSITVYYFLASFTDQLPWSICNPEWGSNYCDSEGNYIGSANVSLSQLYYEKTVFPQKKCIDDGLGLPDWHLTICLAFSWAFTFVTLGKGVKSSGRVAYFTALFPYLILVILLVRGVTLEGAWDGILYFIKPQWDQLIEPKVWFAAISQCFFSLATGFGTITMFSSYNNFRHNIYRDVVIISITDTFTSLLAGFTIFGVLGHLAHTLDVDIKNVAKDGPGLTFISYPAAIAKFQYVPQLFSCMFFGMLFCLGIGSVSALAGCIITIICDEFPKWIRWKVTLFVCVAGFLVGLIYLTPGGGFMLTLIDHFGANFIIYMLAMIEVSAISWVYGLDNFCEDIHFMLGLKVSWYWKICWKFIIPIGLGSLIVFIMSMEKQLTYEGVAYPPNAIVCGYALLCFPLLLLPICAIYNVWTADAPTFYERLVMSVSPSKEWGPTDITLKKEWMLLKNKHK